MHNNAGGQSDKQRIKYHMTPQSREMSDNTADTELIPVAPMQGQV